MEKFEISKLGNYLVFKKGYTSNVVKKIIEENNLNGLIIPETSDSIRLDKLDFLNEYSYLKSLSIAHQTGYHYDFLKYLTSLESLNLIKGGEGEIDLSNQHDLKYLTLYWRSEIKGLDRCKNLKQIGLNEWKEKDLSILKGLTNLQKVTIKTSTITDVGSLSELFHLEYLLLGNCKRLTSIKGINGLNKLKSLELNLCPKIQDYNQLDNLPALEVLKIIDCKRIPSIKFITNFSLLKKLFLTGNTEVLDGDMKPAQEIEEVYYRHRNNYNVKIENKKGKEIRTRNLLKLKDILNGNDSKA